LTGLLKRVYREFGASFGFSGCLYGSPMGNFGEDLRMERIARGVALEDITAITKISQRQLLALEQERFRLLPGGILSKGIVRGYTGALGLDQQAQQAWTERFMKACNAAGAPVEDEGDWTAFAENVGRARILRREAAQERLRWTGAAVLAGVVAFGALLTIRYYGYRSGWWPSVLPTHIFSIAFRSTWTWIHAQCSRLASIFGG
jgi:cytoskeleton protein RodZ